MKTDVTVTTKKSDLEIMQEMAELDPSSVLVSTNITDLKKTKNGGKITFEVSSELYHKLSKQFGLGVVTHYPMMIIPEKELFDKVYDNYNN